MLLSIRNATNYKKYKKLTVQTCLNMIKLNYGKSGDGILLIEYNKCNNGKYC